MRCYAAFVRQQLRALTLYRFEFFVKILYGLLAMYGARCLWTALYRQNPALLERTLPEMITYAMLAMALDMVFYPSGDNSVQSYMNEQVRRGSIDTDLLRPMDFQLQMLSRNSSYILCMLLVLVLPACTAGMLLMGMRLPASPLHAAAFAVSLALAYLVLFSLNFLLGLLSMLVMNIKQIAWAYRGLVSLLSGALIPLWLFPARLRAALGALPFRCIYDVPLNVYTGALNGGALAGQLALQLAWAAALFALGRAAWHAVHRRMTVQGG